MSKGMVQNIFVVGTGRSGTHFVARSLRGFKNTRDPLAGREDNGLLRRVAHDAMLANPLSQECIANIRKRTSPRKTLIDQHHPLLFFTKDLVKEFPGALFLYINRPIEQVVASMLSHSGVLDWYQRLKDPTGPLSRAPFPNQFFGLFARAEIHNLSVTRLCARRWLAHRSMAQQLKLKTLEYENLVADQFSEYSRVLDERILIDLGQFRQRIKANPDSLVKWKSSLSKSQTDELKMEVKEWDFDIFSRTPRQTEQL
jgi:hypothetical protein